MTLNDLKPNESGYIISIDSVGNMKRRLIDMGVTCGAKVTMLRIAPLGDPIEFLVRGYKLSIRREEAKKIHLKGKVNGNNNG